MPKCSGRYRENFREKNKVMKGKAMIKQFHIVLSVLAVVVIVSAGCGKKAVKGCADGCTEPAAGGAGHSAEHADANDSAGKDAHAATVSFEKRVMTNCEHKMPIYQCDECRYEAGVVKLDKSILKISEGVGLVKTQAVTRTKMTFALAVTGEVALNENAAVHISPRISGTIDSVAVDIGGRVKAGETLFTMTSVELGRTLVGYERNAALALLAEKTFAREKSLKDQNVGSEQDMINAQMVYEQHRTELKASEQTLHVLGLTEDDLSGMKVSPHGSDAGKLPVRAPIAGTIIAKHAVAGEMAEPGKDVMLLADLSTVWVWVDLHSRDLPQLLAAEKAGAIPVDVSVSAFPGKKFSGTLTYIGATMSEKTRTVKVRATVGNSDLLLRPGMFCEAAIAIDSKSEGDVLAVPRNAIFMDGGKSFVFKHWKDDFFVRQDVVKGRELPAAVEILEGLKEGDMIVADGGFLLKSDVLREKMGAGCAD